MGLVSTAMTPPEPSPGQRRVLELWSRDLPEEAGGAAGAGVASQRRVIQVIGGPGSGKSTLAVEVISARVAAGAVGPEQCLVIAPTRRAAARLRAAVTARIGGTTTEPLARTASSLAFDLLTQDAIQRQDPTPRLLSGAEQDLVLGELLRGHREDGAGPSWPQDLQAALATRGFRDQLRDLLMGAVEHGVSSSDLADLGRAHARPEWVAAAHVLTEYDQVTALSRPGAFDPAWIGAAAADLLEDDAEAADRVHRRVRLVVVDDAQELTASAARLVKAVAGSSADLVLLGDGDVTAQSFRGAEPHRWSELAGEVASPHPSEQIVLQESHRYGRQIATAVRRVADRIGVSNGTAHRDRHMEEDHGGAALVPDAGACRAVVLRSTAQECAHVAQELRKAHLIDGVPWSELAVITRSRSRHEQVRRALSVAGIPVTMPGGGTPLAQHPVVRVLLTAYAVALRTPQEDTPAATPEEAMTLLGSVLGGADPLALRRIRSSARRWEREAEPALPAGPGQDSPDQALAALLDRPEVAALLGAELAPVVRVGRVLAHGRGAEGGAEAVLWAIWQASGLAADWEAASLGTGPAADRADRDLDAVMVLFGAAADFTERMPAADPEAFLDHVAAQEVAADTLTAQAARSQAVALLTPQSAAGGQWQRVYVMGVQEGVWPDLRLRDTLLGGQQLAEVVAGRTVAGAAGARQAQARIRADELRQFHLAISRATHEVVVSAVAAAEEQPSGYLDLIDPIEGPRPLLEVGDALTLRGAVAALRRTLVRAHREQDHRLRDACAGQLARLARAGVAGADPWHWWLERDLSDRRPVHPARPVPVSPSSVQAFVECPLRWLLAGRGGQPADRSDKARIGTLIHEIIAERPAASLEELQATLDRRWSELALGSGWIVDRERDRAAQMLRRYVGYHQQQEERGDHLAGVEQPISADVGDARIVGQVDRVEVGTDGKVRIVDLKTGSSAPSVAATKENPQLGAYQVALESGGLDSAFAGPGVGRESAGAALVLIGGNSKGATVREQPPLAKAEDPQWARTMVQQVAVGSAGSEFPAQIGDWCRTCPVAYSCPAQGEGQMLS